MSGGCVLGYGYFLRVLEGSSVDFFVLFKILGVYLIFWRNGGDVSIVKKGGYVFIDYLKLVFYDLI